MCLTLFLSVSFSLSPSLSLFSLSLSLYLSISLSLIIPLNLSFYFFQLISVSFICSNYIECKSASTFLYLLYLPGRNEIYSFKETSTCEYEIVVLTSTLCEHPHFKPKGNHSSFVLNFDIKRSVPPFFEIRMNMFVGRLINAIL